VLYVAALHPQSALEAVSQVVVDISLLWRWRHGVLVLVDLVLVDVLLAVVTAGIDLVFVALAHWCGRAGPTAAKRATRAA